MIHTKLFQQKLSLKGGTFAFLPGSGLFHRTRPVFSNEISNIAYEEFLVCEVDYGKKIIEEACRKHPLNPKDVPRQKPGEDLAPIPVVNDMKLSGDAVRKQSQRVTSFQPAQAPGKPTPKMPDQTPPMQVTEVGSIKKPTAAINSARSAQIQQQAALSDDKKYKCHLCGKLFRVLLALKNHMVIRHDGAEVQLSTDNGASAAVVNAGVPTKSTPSTSSVPRVSLTQIENISVESTSEERSTLRSSLLDLWDTLGKEKWGREKYQHCRIYTEKEIRILAENTKNNSEGIRTAQESGMRQSTAVQPKPIASFTLPKATPIFEPKPIAESTAPSPSMPPGTFNPFASLVSEEGTTAPVFETSPSTPAASTPTTPPKGKGPVEIMVDGEKKYQCTICGKAFKTQTGLTGHFETKHPGQATGVTTSGTTTEGGKYAIPVNLEDIPAYVPTPVDMSKFPGQGTGEVDPKAAALAEELKNATVSLEQDVVVHARACTNITLSGVVVEMQSGYQGLIPVLQFSLVVESDVQSRTYEDKDGTSQVERTTHPPETIIVRVYGSALVKRAQASIREGNLVLVIGLLKLNPVPLGNKCYNNPYVTVSDGGGAVMALV